jgi:hypothetical protein
MTRKTIKPFLIVALLCAFSQLLIPAMPAAATPLGNPGDGYTTAPCESPVLLAQARKWTFTSDAWVDKQYGGLQVTVQSNTANPWMNYLPAGWAFVSSNQNIRENDTSRWINPGVGTLYAPPACRGNGNLQQWLNTPLPAQQQSASPPQGGTTCTDNPFKLAQSKGWTALFWEPDTRYNGLEVFLQFGSSLPVGWAADGGTANRHIGPSDTWRGMESGVWTIYAPLNCQAQVVQTPVCLNPLNLAAFKGWKFLRWEPDRQWNGLEVWLNYGNTLPWGWAADGGTANRHIGPSDTWRGMESGQWTIYGPQECQAGYAQITAPTIPLP